MECERALRAADGAAVAREANRLAADLYGLARSVAKRSGRVDLAVVARRHVPRRAAEPRQPHRAYSARYLHAPVTAAGRTTTRRSTASGYKLGLVAEHQYDAVGSTGTRPAA